ncbi:MAG: hypothetical protein R2745_02165 [Vicinamibacterales bacterium]
MLSEDGRKAALLEGRDGRAVQSVTLQVPASRLHLVSVDREGVARLRLRPRFELDADERVQRVDAAPVYDVPPTVEELFRAAARNHELEAAYHASRQSAVDRRLEGERDVRLSAAERFMADKTARAVPHPPPTARSCMLVTPQGRLRFDVRSDVGLAKDVPAEAHRRFRADQRTRAEKNKADRAAQLAVHQEKKRFIAAWIAELGTDEQRERHAAGLLPMAEAIEAITDHAFAALASMPRYVLDGADRLRRAMPDLGAAVIHPGALRVQSEDAQTATAEQFALVREIQSLVPAASVVLRRHRITVATGAPAPTVVAFGVLVSQKRGVVLLRREFAVLNAQ